MKKGGAGKVLRSSGWVSLLFVLIAALALTPGAASGEKGYTPPHDRPGPAVDRIFFKAVHVDIAPASLRRGDIDIYFYSLKKEAAAALRGAPGIKIYEAPATMLSLILNPAPAPEGELNPFSLREVRFALQFLINRDFIAQEIFKGLARPMVTFVSPFDFDYLTVADVVREYNITYDPGRAREMIKKAMEGAGAVLKEGRWYYKDKPVEVRFIIRVEDERREIGDLIRAELEKVGFTVVPIYHPFAPAILTVYGSDPRLFEWHLYTEGWGRGAAERYDYATANQMAAPWLGNMPGWQEVGFWQYRNEKLDELGQRLFRGEFKDREERDELYREIVRLSLEESVRIWLAAVINTFPSREEVNGVTEDMIAGPKSLWTLRETYIPGKESLTVGNLWVWTERTTWNPVGGFGDVYSVDIWRNIYDPLLATHPFRGLPIPFRARFEVETAGPEGKLKVPRDAFRWDAGAKKFLPVPPGTEATSRVVFDLSKYFNSTWHHGRPITWADVLYSLYQIFDIVYDEKKAKIEPAIAVTSRPYLDTFKGFRIVGDDRLEVYVDNWHFEPSYIAAYAGIIGLSMPWEILAAMDRLVFEERRAAYSDTAAQRYGVRWLNLVMPKDARMILRVLREFEEEKYLPRNVFEVAGRSLVTPEEALSRYRAAIGWIERYNLAVISNGPFKLVRFDPAAQFAELEAFRDPSYPFKPGDWYFGSAPRLVIEEVAGRAFAPGSRAEIKVRLSGPEPSSLRYTFYDPLTRSIVKAGEAERTGPGEFSIVFPPELTAGLKPGLFKLSLLAYSEEVASPAEESLDIEVTAGVVRPTPAAAPPPSPGGLPASLLAALGAALAVVLALIILLMLRRRATP